MSTSFRDFLTVLALSLHAIFEGLAVGLGDDEEGVWVLFAAICSHKFVMSFCIGVELGRIHLSCSTDIWAVFTDCDILNIKLVT